MNARMFAIGMGVVLIMVLTTLLIQDIDFSSTELIQVPYNRIDFVEETNGYVGSYQISRKNYSSSWEEWGEWSTNEYFFTFGGPRVCFGYFDRFSGTATFRASSGYHWNEIQDGNRVCLRLEKIK